MKIALRDLRALINESLRDLHDKERNEMEARRKADDERWRRLDVETAKLAAKKWRLPHGDTSERAQAAFNAVEDVLSGVSTAQKRKLWLRAYAAVLALPENRLKYELLGRLARLRNTLFDFRA